MAVDDRDLRGARASTLVVCVRQAYFQTTDLPRLEWDPELLRIFARGRRIGQLIADEMEEDLRAQDRQVVREKAIPWGPGGRWTGHADLFIPDEGHTIEVVSTADCALPEHKARQVAFYSMHDPESEQATVLSVDPSTNDERAYPINVEFFEDDLRERLALHEEAVRAGDPERAPRATRPGGDLTVEVQSPSEWPCFNCPFRAHCWEGWVPPEPGRLPVSALGIASVLEGVEDEVRRQNAKAPKSLVEQRDALRQQLAGLMRPREEYVVGDMVVKYTEVAGRRTFDLAAFEKAGHRLPEEAQAFVRTSAGHQRWTFKPYSEREGGLAQ